MIFRKKNELMNHLPSDINNKGFTQIPDCVTMCYDLTPDEKAMYLMLLKNFNNNLGYAFPSWENMKFVLGRGDTKINTTLKGLIHKSLIKKKKAAGRNNKYYLLPLKEVPSIALSEATYRFIKENLNEEEIPYWKSVIKFVRSDKYEVLKDNFDAQTTIVLYYKQLEEHLYEDVGIVLENKIYSKSKPLPF